MRPIKRLLQNPIISFAEALHHGGSAVFNSTARVRNRLLLAKYAYVVDEIASPERVRVFTNTRLDSFRVMHDLAPTNPIPLLSSVQTFHSFCENIIRKHTPLLSGLQARTENFSVWGGVTVATALQDLFPNLTPSGVRKSISTARFDKNSTCELTQKYNEYLHKNNALDFDDLLIYARQLLENDAVCQQYREEISYVFLDALEDVRFPQAEVLAALTRTLPAPSSGPPSDTTAHASPSITCVAMYQPHHARFREDLRATRLVQNTVCKKAVYVVSPDATAATEPEAMLRAVCAHFLCDTNRLPIDSVGSQLVIPLANGLSEQAEFIASELPALAAEGIRAHDLLTVYFSNTQRDTLRDQLTGRGVRCHVVADVDPSKDDIALTVLTALCNPQDSAALAVLMLVVSGAPDGVAPTPAARANAVAAAAILQRVALAMRTTPARLVATNLRMLAGLGIPDVDVLVPGLQPVFTAAISAIEGGASMHDVVSTLPLPGWALPSDSSLRRAAVLFDKHASELVEAAAMSTPVGPQSLSRAAHARVLTFLQQRPMLTTIADDAAHDASNSLPLISAFNAKGARSPCVFITGMGGYAPGRPEEVVSAVATAATRRVYLPLSESDVDHQGTPSIAVDIAKRTLAAFKKHLSLQFPTTWT